MINLLGLLFLLLVFYFIIISTQQPLQALCFQCLAHALLMWHARIIFTVYNQTNHQPSKALPNYIQFSCKCGLTSSHHCKRPIQIHIPAPTSPRLSLSLPARHKETIRPPTDCPTDNCEGIRKGTAVARPLLSTFYFIVLLTRH